MKCYRCSAFIYVDSSSVDLQVIHTAGSDESKIWTAESFLCPACGEITLLIKHGIVKNNIKKTIYRQRVLPNGRKPKQYNIPNYIYSDYVESCKIVDLSPKASAALSRRVLQSILNHIGHNQKNLVEQIQAALSSDDSSRINTLPIDLKVRIDIVRLCGNAAAHQTTENKIAELFEVSHSDAIYCIQIIEEIIDHVFIGWKKKKFIR
jgi:hypothetical protein